MDPRPRLTRPVHPLHRPDGTIQLGLDPGSALVAIGVSAPELRWLGTLDGSRTAERAVADAVTLGIGEDRAHEIIEAFAAQGVLDLTGVGRTLESRVAVVGAGSLPSHLVDVLREAGVREVVRCLDEPEDAGTDLAVITSTVPVAAGAGEPWRRAGVPHLPVWCTTGHASICPLLVPGEGPCLQCLELTRVGLDPGWSWIRAQISRPRIGPVVPVDAEVPLRSLITGLAAAVAIDVLLHGARASGWSVDASTPGPTLERRHWVQHPCCVRCSDRPGSTLPASDQADPQQWVM